MFFNVQLQLKISVIVSRILRNNTALAGAACVGGCIWQTLLILSRCHFSAEKFVLCLDGPGSGRDQTVGTSNVSLVFGQ